MFAIRRPDRVARAECHSAVLKVAARDLSGRPTLGWDDEYVRVPRLQVTRAVEPLDELVDHLRGVGPFRAGRRLGHLDERARFFRDVRNERDPLSVRGPAETRRRILEVGELRRLTGVEPHPIDLRRAIAIRE